MAKHAKHAAPPRRRRSAQKHISHKGVTLYTLGVLLVAVSALLFLRFWPRRSVDTVPPAVEVESPAVSEELAVPEPQPVVTTLRFSATGDSLIHEPIYSQAARRAAEGEGYSFDYCYMNLLDFYAQQDINWINQETLCSKELAPSTYPCFSTPGECAEALYRAGFRVFSLSNNHTYDKGAAGIAATLRFWETMPEDVITTGLWKGEADYGRIPIQTVDGVKIAYLSYTEHTNGIPRNSKMTANIIYTSQQDVMEQQVRAARQEADFVVVGVHWGVEDSHNITQAQRTLAQSLADWGADVIIGTHPHVLQKMEAYNGGYIFYSLGNFSFGGNTAPRDVDTAIAQVTVKKDGYGWTIDGYDLIPCRLSSTDSKNDYRPRPYKEDEEGYARVLSKLDGSWTGSDLNVDYSFMYR